MENKFSKLLSDYSTEEKIFLYNSLYEELSGKGICGDTELAHVNKHEMAVLRAMGGSGTINENTQCVQFFGSPPPPPPVTTTSVQTKEIPEELRPYVREVLSEAQDIYKTRKEEGYVPYTGEEIAPFSPEQERAYALTAEQVGQTQRYATPAAAFATMAGIAPSGQEIASYIDPFTQQVIDIQEREARRASDLLKQEQDLKAVQSGAFGGSRQAIVEAERGRNLAQQIGDFRAKGLSAAYQQALDQAQEQRQRQLGAASMLTGLAQVAPTATAEEIARLEAAGAARRGQAQSGLDIAQRKFVEKRTFPETTLAQYSQFIQPTQQTLGAAGTRTDTGPGQAQPTYLQQASGFLGSLGKAYGAFKSDPREKTDIKKIGMDDATGLAMYSFRYRDDPKTYPKVVGPMSDEVKEKYPELVSEIDGVEVVDFGGLASIANMNKEENSVALQEGGLVGDPRFSYIPDPEDETPTQQTEPYTEEEQAALDEANESGFLETVSSGLSSIGGFLTERPKTGDPYREVMKGPTRLESISDLLIGYSQADPSKPLGIQLGQAAAATSKEEKAERQRRLLNAIKREELRQAERLLGIKARSAGVLTQPQRYAALKTIQELNDPRALLDAREGTTDRVILNAIDRKLATFPKYKPTNTAKSLAQKIKDKQDVPMKKVK